MTNNYIGRAFVIPFFLYFFFLIPEIKSNIWSDLYVIKL